jgi:hypothetical protein
MDNQRVFAIVVEENVTTKDEWQLGYGFCRGEAVPSGETVAAQGHVLAFVTLDSKTEATVRAEAAEFILEKKYSWSSYNDVYESRDSGRGLANLAIFDPNDAASYTLFGGSQQGFVLLRDGHFDGIALWLESSGGNGWNGSHRGGYCLQFTDGRILGNNEESDSFSGEDSSSSSETTFTLKKKSEASEPFSR